MADKRDYYEVLGLQKGASADDVKSAYRKAALKWHPDRWVSGTDEEKKTAEANFKEASEAYSVLSDPDKKARYDQFGFAGVNGAGGGFGGGGDFGGFDINEILRSVFGAGFNFGGGGGGGFNPFGGFGGFGGGRPEQRRMRGRDIRTRVRLTLEEIMTGCEKEVTIERNRPCKDCGGKGTKNDSDIKTCPTCHGTGQIQQQVRSLFGMSVSYSPCPNCHGEGKVVSNPCKSCKGTGLVRVKETIKVKIPAGVMNGMQLSLRSEGHSAPRGGENGDLLVVIEELQHQHFKREDNNLFYTKVIPITDAVLGAEIVIPCLDGPYKMKLDSGTQSGTVIRLKGKGLPSANGYGYGKGDLYVKILVWIPRKLSRSQKEIFEKMRQDGDCKVDPNREDRALFEKESQYY